MLYLGCLRSREGLNLNYTSLFSGDKGTHKQPFAGNEPVAQRVVLFYSLIN